MVRGQQTQLGLLQLATREHCLLVRIGQMARPLPPRLAALLGADGGDAECAAAEPSTPRDAALDASLLDAIQLAIRVDDAAWPGSGGVA